MAGQSNERVVAWSKSEPFGAEWAQIDLSEDRMRAMGVAIGSEPLPYRLDFELETDPGLVTSTVRVTTQGNGWHRSLSLSRHATGGWDADVNAEGDVDLPEPGGDMSQFGEALDPDLGLSPVFNSMPVLRYGLLNGGVAPELLMLWISVPDLAVHPSPQRYKHLRRLKDGNSLIRFEAPDPDEGDFLADVVFDSEGIVVDYPGIAKRIRESGT